MDKNTVLYYAQTDEEKLLLSKIYDNYLKTRDKGFNTFSDFLDISKLLLVEKAFSNCDVILKLYGGYKEAERKISAFLVNEDASFPISVLEINAKGIDELSHRDFLGSLMALGIKRDTVGDIIIDNSCKIIVKSEVSEFIKLNLKKVANKNVTVEYYDKNDIKREQKFELMVITVSSARLDSVLAAVYNIKRTDAVKLILQGRVNVDFCTIQASDYKLKEGQIISVKGYGRCIYNLNKGISKKGKSILEIKKML